MPTSKIMKFIISDGLFLEQFPCQHKTDDIAEKAIMQNGNAFKFLTRKQKNNQELAIMAIENGAIPNNQFPPPIRSNYHIMMKSVEIDGNNLFYLQHNFKQDINISVTAVLSKPEAIKFVSPKIIDKVMLITRQKRRRKQ